MSDKSDFYESSMRVRRTLEVGSNVTQVGAGATTGVIFAVIGHSFVREFLPPTLAFIFSAIVMLIGVGVFELCTRRTLPFGLDELLGKKWKQENENMKKKYRRYFMVAMLLLSFGLMFGSMSTSWFARTDMAEAAVEAPKRADLEGMSKEMLSQQKSDREWYDKEIKRLQASESQRIKAAEQEGKQKMNAAIMSKGKKMAGEYRSGNGWAANQLKSAINMAKESSASAIARERNKVNEMIKKRDATLSTGANPTLTVIEHVARQENVIQGEYRAKKARNQWLIGAFGVSCTILFFLFQLGLSFIRIMCDETTVSTHESRGIIGSIMDQIERGKELARQRNQGGNDQPIAMNEAVKSAPRVTVKTDVPFDVLPSQQTEETPVKTVKSPRKTVKSSESSVSRSGSGKPKATVKNKRVAVKAWVVNYIQENGKVPTAIEVSNNLPVTDKTVRKYMKEDMGIVNGKFVGDDDNPTFQF